MRTTLTIDDDVAAELERLRRLGNKKFKALVNEALRHGLQQMTAPPKKQKPFRTRSFDVGGVLVKNIDNIGEILAEIEGEWHH
jgi:hypothetical protein